MKANPARIVVNARFIGRPLTGVERYASQVTARLGSSIRLVAPAHSLRGAAGHLWEQASLPFQVGAGDLLWSPLNSGPLSVTNQVVTIHDLSPLDHPEWFRPSFARWYAYLLPRLVRRVRRVITDSHFSRQRLLDRLDLDENQVVCVPPGVDLQHFSPQPEVEIERTRQCYGLPRSYFLVVGSLEPRKNLPRLLQAWERAHFALQAAAPGLALVLAGAGNRAFRPAGLDRLPPGVILAGYVAEKDLPAIYSGALALIFPALYEGFGLPLLEAMACGAPVAAARAGALPETGGPATLLFDPLQVDEIADCLLRLAGDPALRRNLRAGGCLRAACFSPDRTAHQVWDVLQQAALGYRAILA